MRDVLSVSSHWPVSCTDARTSAQNPYSFGSARKAESTANKRTRTGETTQLNTELCDCLQNQKLFHSKCIHTPTVSLWLYLIEYVRVSRVEEIGQPFLYPFDHLRPHRVHQEIVTWHYVCFVTEERENIGTLKICYDTFYTGQYVSHRLILC